MMMMMTTMTMQETSGGIHGVEPATLSSLDCWSQVLVEMIRFGNSSAVKVVYWFLIKSVKCCTRFFFAIFDCFLSSVYFPSPPPGFVEVSSNDCVINKHVRKKKRDFSLW